MDMSIADAKLYLKKLRTRPEGVVHFAKCDRCRRWWQKLIWRTAKAIREAELVGRGTVAL